MDVPLLGVGTLKDQTCHGSGTGQRTEHHFPVVQQVATEQLAAVVVEQIWLRTMSMHHLWKTVSSSA
jgi:hypothetical protein